MTIEDPKDLDEKLAAEENPYILFFKNKTLEPCDFSKFSPC